MIVYKYYVIYVEVPTGYPGVEDVSIPLFYGYSKSDIRQFLEEAFYLNLGRAILDILEAN